MEIDAPLPGQHSVPHAEAAERLAAFWDRAYTEYNMAKSHVLGAGRTRLCQRRLRALRLIRR